jgi:hypothetical protein
MSTKISDLWFFDSLPTYRQKLRANKICDIKPLNPGRSCSLFVRPSFLPWPVSSWKPELSLIFKIQLEHSCYPGSTKFQFQRTRHKFISSFWAPPHSDPKITWRKLHSHWLFYLDSFPIFKRGFYWVRHTQHLDKGRKISNDILKRKKGGKSC